MTPQQVAALMLVVERAGEQRESARVNVTGINHNTLASLIRRCYVTLNDDDTITLTDKGLLTLRRLQDMMARRSRRSQRVGQR